MEVILVTVVLASVGGLALGLAAYHLGFKHGYDEGWSDCSKFTTGGRA